MSCLPPSSAGWLLPAMISWIGPLGVQQQRLEPLGVAQHQGQPLVGRHAAGEADGQDVGVEGGRRPAQLGLGGPAGQRGLPDPAAHLLDQPAAQRPADAPQVAGRDLVDAVEVDSPSTLDRVALAGGLRAHLDQLAGGPRRGVHAVGDRADRHVVLVEARPQVAEHAAADVPVQLADAVGALPQPQAHVRHVELRRVLLGAEREQLVQRARRSRRSSARSAPWGTGRCRPAPGCAW